MVWYLYKDGLWWCFISLLWWCFYRWYLHLLLLLPHQLVGLLHLLQSSKSLLLVVRLQNQSLRLENQKLLRKWDSPQLLKIQNPWIRILYPCLSAASIYTIYIKNLNNNYKLWNADKDFFDPTSRSALSAASLASWPLITACSTSSCSQIGLCMTNGHWPWTFPASGTVTIGQENWSNWTSPRWWRLLRHLSEKLSLLVEQHSRLSTSPAVVVHQAGQVHLLGEHSKQMSMYGCETWQAITQNRCQCIDISNVKPCKPVVRVPRLGSHQPDKVLLHAHLVKEWYDHWYDLAVMLTKFSST